MTPAVGNGAEDPIYDGKIGRPCRLCGADLFYWVRPMIWQHKLSDPASRHCGSPFPLYLSGGSIDSRERIDP